MSSKVKITYTQQFLDLLENHLEDTAEKSAEEIKILAQDYCPVETGALRSSIEVTKEGENFLIGSDLDYANVVEWGSLYQAPQPFLRPALSEVLNNEN